MRQEAAAKVGRSMADSMFQALHVEGIPTSLDSCVINGTDVEPNHSSAWNSMKLNDRLMADSSLQALQSEGVPTSLDSCVVNGTDVESNPIVDGMSRFHGW